MKVSRIQLVEAELVAYNVIRYSTPILEGAAVEVVDEEVALVEDLIEVVDGRSDVVSVVKVRAVD